ncbi:MAG: PHP domain-containing protein [Alphaproteobacteria bacterium]|nr:PHP domain-containing protein [Alphaproteobacteria bacterium]
MAQDFTLHTHTDIFDGKNTVSEMAQRAKDLGMSAIGISNHFIVHPDICDAQFYPFAVRGGYANMYHTTFADTIRDFTTNYAEIDQAATQSGTRILRGMEVDYFHTPAWYRGFTRAIKILRPDYIIGSCHFIEYGGRLCNVHDMAMANDVDRAAMLKLYWDKIAQAASSGLFTFMAHLDLPKKVGLGCSVVAQDAQDRALDIISRNKTPLEINTSGIKQCGAMYPSAQILERVAQENIPVLISDDAHHVSQIGRHFDVARALAQDYRIKNFLTLNTLRLDEKNR